MRKTISFIIQNEDLIQQKIIQYFDSAGFEIKKQEVDHLLFEHSSSLFEAWKKNPIQWHSEISIWIKGNLIKADFLIDTTVQMNTKEEYEVWNTYIQDFQNYLSDDLFLSSKILDKIKTSKQKRTRYNAFGIIGAIAGACISTIFSKLCCSNTLFHIICIPFFATIALRWKINYEKNKSAA